MNKKIFENSRFCPKGDTEANWNKAVGFIPLDKEIIIYKPDETHSAARFKIGDGKTVVQDLPFSGTDIEAIEKLIDEKGELLIKYVDNAVAAIAQVDWNQTDETAKDYVKNRPFYEDKIILVEWDGSIEGHEYIQVNEQIYLVKVSNNIYTAEELSQYTVTAVTADGVEDMPVSELNMQEAPGGLVIDIGAIVSSFEEFAQETGMPFASNGTYFMKVDVENRYVSSLNKIELKKIDSKFLPNEIKGKNNEQDNRLAELEGRVTTVTFNITAANATISLKNLYGMTKIDWGDGSVNNELSHTYTTVGEYVCKIYDVTSIGKAAFYNCDSLTSVIIPDSVTNIGRDAFYNCDSLTSVTIGNSVTSIGYGAFCDCRKLTSVVISDGATFIGSYMFGGCSSLMSIEIPDSVTSIGHEAFSGCSSLTSVVIPDSVTSIGNHGFTNCNSLTSVFFKNPTPITYNIDTPWFESCLLLTHIYVPYDCKQAYIKQWSADGAPQDILDKIVESDREAMMSDLNSGLDTKLNKSGGLIGGNLSIQGNLTISGETTTLDTVTLQVQDNVIVANADGVELVENAGFAMKTSEVSAYGIMYDPVGDGVKIGLGSFDENGKFNYTEGEDQLLATRANTIVDGHTVVWDDENKTLIDSGVDHSEYVKFTDYPKSNKAGAIKAYYAYGIDITTGGTAYISSATADEIKAKQSQFKPITPIRGDYFIKVGVTTNTETLTDEEKAAALAWLGAVKKSTEVTSRQQVYVKEPDGTQKMVTLSTDFLSNGIPRYNEHGRLTCADPTSAYNTTNKRYVDGLVGDINTVLESILGV